MALTQTNKIVLASGQGATGASSAVNCRAYTTGVVALSGISGDTVVMRGRMDASEGWHTLGVSPMLSAVTSISMTANGLYTFNCNGVGEVSSNVTVYGSGTLDIDIRLTDK